MLFSIYMFKNLYTSQLDLFFDISPELPPNIREVSSLHLNPVNFYV